MSSLVIATYVPRGIPKIVIEHLQRLPPGTKVSSATLAEVAGVSPPSELYNLLDYACKKGALLKLKDPEDLRRTLWTLGDGTPSPRLDAGPDEQPDDHPVLQRLVPLDQWARARPTAAPAPAPEPEPAAPSRQARCLGPALRVALFNDGELLIQRGKESFSFTPTETRQICAYLDRLAPDGAA